MSRGLGWPVTTRRKVVNEYMTDPTSSYTTLSKKHGVPTGTVQRWVERFGTPRSRIHWKKYRRPSVSAIDKARWLVSLGVPKTEAARRSGLTVKMLRKIIKESGNPYNQQDSAE